jgi:calcineurin-like phosphoesterase family protein
MNSKIFFIADTHFGHANIIKYENRPFETVEQMDKAIIQNWRNVVSKHDTIFVLGDFSFYNKEITTKIMRQLTGNKILIKGNHDVKSNQWYLDVGFDEVSKYPIIYNEWYVLQHEPPMYMSSTCPFFYIYGHVHGTKMYQTLTSISACVSVERWNYTPVSLEFLKKLKVTKIN